MITQQYLDDLRGKLQALPESRSICLPVGMTLEGMIDLPTEVVEGIDKHFWELL